MSFEDTRHLNHAITTMPASLRMELVAAACRRNPRFARWLAREAEATNESDSTGDAEPIASAFTLRHSVRMKAALLERSIPLIDSVMKPAKIRGRPRQVMPIAAADRCAVVMSVPVAAGAGIELWDEPCDMWLELPDGTPNGEYMAIPVRGQSMTPLLEESDVILVKVGPEFSPGDVIVARGPRDGYVVKHVDAIYGNSVTLSSLNPEYPGIELDASEHAVVGTVIARLRKTHG